MIEGQRKPEAPGVKKEAGPVDPERFKRAQEAVMKSVLKHIRGEGPLYGEFSEEEQHLLRKMSAEVRKAARENPEAAAVNLDFSKNPEAHKTWSGIINRLARERLG